MNVIYCFLGNELRKDCPCELHPVLPSLYNHMVHHNCNEIDISSSRNSLSVVSEIVNKSQVQSTAGNTTLDSIERGGPTVGFRATVQRVLCQFAPPRVRYHIVKSHCTFN